MKLTTARLKQLIKEELSNILGEQEMSIGDAKIDAALEVFAQSDEYKAPSMDDRDGVMPRGDITDQEMMVWNENNPQQLRPDPTDEDMILVSS